MKETQPFMMYGMASLACCKAHSLKFGSLRAQGLMYEADKHKHIPRLYCATECIRTQTKHSLFP